MPSMTTLLALVVAAADEEAGGAAGLAGLGDLDAGHVAERLLDVADVGELVAGEDGDGGADLGEGRRGAGGGDGDFLLGVGGGGEGEVEGRVGVSTVEEARARSPCCLKGERRRARRAYRPLILRMARK